MDSVIVGHSPTSNALMVFNPWNRQYYEPDSYQLDFYCLPCLMYPTLKYNGSLFVSLLWDANPSFEEKYPPGTRVECIDPTTNMLLAGTVMDIPFPLSPSAEDSQQSYIILFDNGTTASVPFNKMAGIIPLPPIDVGSLDSANSVLPPFLRLNSKITFKHEGQYHKGFLGQRNGCFRFVYKLHINKQKEDWSVLLPNLLSTWIDMCIEGILLPGHISHTFLCMTTSPSPTSQSPSTFNPVASFVSALNLH
jgi:hypothetical protein